MKKNIHNKLQYNFSHSGNKSDTDFDTWRSRDGRYKVAYWSDTSELKNVLLLFF